MNYEIVEPNNLPNVVGEIVIADTETTGLNVIECHPFMLQLGIAGKVYVLRWTNKVVEWIDDNLLKAKLVVGHNLKFDLHMFIQGGCDAEKIHNYKVYDTMISESLINENHHSFSLDNLCKHYFKSKKNDDVLINHIVENIIGGTRKRTESSVRKLAMAHLSEAPFEMVAEYGAGDITLTEQLFWQQIKLITKEEPDLMHFPKKYHTLEHALDREMSVLKALVEMERRGVPVNIQQIEEKEVELTKLRKELAAKCNSLVKFEFDVGSSLHKEKAFKELGVDIYYKPETGNPSFSKKVMEGTNHPLAKYLMEIATLDKILSSYTSSMQDLYNPRTGKIYCSFFQTKGEGGGARTGRFSCGSPNLQQVPKPNKGKGPTSYMTSKIIRSAYYAPKGTIWGSCDWSQFENRVFAHYSNDKKLVKSYADDPDIDYHALVMRLMDLENVLGLDFKSARGRAKTINLGLSFGMGKGELADQMGLPWSWEEFTQNSEVIRYKKAGSEAEQLFRMYHDTFPTVQPTLDSMKNLVLTRGYLVTLGGKRLHLPKKFARKAGPYMFQGNAADIMKEKLVEVNELTRNTECELLLSVHDEFDTISPEETAVSWNNKIKDIMENVPQLDIPIRADVGLGKTWFEASA